MTTYTITEHHKHSFEHFRRLNKQWRETYFPDHSGHDELLHNPGLILHEGGCVFYAIANNKIVGCGGLRNHQHGIYEIVKMAVDPKYQEMGMGTALLKALITRFNTQSGNRLFLQTHSNLTAAIKLYQKHHFVEASTEKNSIQCGCNTHMEYQNIHQQEP